MTGLGIVTTRKMRSKTRRELIGPLALAIISIVAPAGILLPVEAMAATAADWELCERGYPPEKGIAGCTKIINNTRESTADRIKALLQRAWTHSFNKDIEAAYADGDKAIKLDPSRAATYETRARILVGVREIDRPIADYTTAIELDANAHRLFERGELYRKKGEQELAIADFKEARARLNKDIAAHPDSPWLYHSRSNVHRNLGEIDEALSDFSEFLKRKKDSGDTWIAERGDLYLRKGDLERAIADYSEAINKQPDSTDRYDRRALAYRLKGDYKRAILDYDQMVRLDDENPETYIGRGLAYVAAGKPERAVVDFTMAIDLYPEDATAFYNRAQAQRQSGNTDVAIGDYSAAIERNPRYAIAFNSRGRAYLAQNDAARALADFNEAVRLQPKLGAAYYNRAFLHHSTGRMDEAIADFGRAIATDPGNKNFLIARASAFAASGSHADAERDLTAALRIDPVDAIAYAGRAASRLKLGALANGLNDANRALLLNGELVSAYAVRADIYEALRQADNATADRAAANGVKTRQADRRRAIEATRKSPRIKVTISGAFPKQPASLKGTFKLDTVVEVRDDDVVYRTPGLPPYKLASGDKIEEKFFGLCDGKQASDQGLRVIEAAVDKYLIYVELQSRVDFKTGACRGRHNYYKESFLIDFSDGACKFTYRQERDVFNVGAFDNKVLDQSCAIEPLRE